MSATEKEIETEVSSTDNRSVDPEKNATLEPRQQNDDEDTSQHLSGLRLGLIILGLCLAVLLVGLVSLCSETMRKFTD
jgi:hypothetical protein